MRLRPRQAAFTLVELVVAIAVGGIVTAFAAMFLLAPLGAFDAQSRRQDMVGDLSAAWPRLQRDLQDALPNSVRTRSNGNYVVLELLPVIGVTRYTAAANINSLIIDAAGSPAGVIKGQPADQPVPLDAYLSVNPDANVYTLSGSITNTRRALTWTTNVANGAGTLTVTGAAPNFSAGDSPRRRLYLVDAPVTYLCDLRPGQGTIRRYSGYTIAANHASRDAPNEFATATRNELIARGITACTFGVHGAAAPHTVSARFTTTRNGESVTLLHQSRAEYLP